jgi:hypothetical protein
MYTLSYNQESAEKAGGNEYISEGGPYVIRIESAVYKKAKTGTKGIEFSVVTKEGLKSNYITVYYEKANGEKIKSGEGVLSAMMGIMGLKGLTSIKKGEDEHCPELEGKTMGLFLQKVLKLKTDRSETYGFDIRVPFHPKTKQTLKEILANAPATVIDNFTASYKDKDDRKRVTQQSGDAPDYESIPIGSYDDDIPF